MFANKKNNNLKNVKNSSRRKPIMTGNLKVVVTTPDVKKVSQHKRNMEKKAEMLSLKNNEEENGSNNE